MVDAVDSIIHDLILQLVKSDKAYQDSGISRLLPIETVYKGYGLHNGVQKISFDPPEEYGKSYEIEVNLSDDNDRIIKFTKVNNDIQKYNEWATGECRKYDQEMEGSKWQKPMYEYQLWQFVVTPAKPNNYRKVDMDDMMKSIDSEELYHLKESLPENEFVPRFNKTIYDYVRMRVDEAKEMDVWDENNIWYIPNQEFAHWFQAKGLQIADIDSLIKVDGGDDTEETNINGLSPNSKWNEVTICIEPTLKSDIPNIRITTPVYNECSHPSKFGFTDKNQPDDTNQLFETLRTFALLGGELTADKKVHVSEKQVSRLRTHLSELFGITEPSISNYTKLSGWRCNFSISDKRHEEGGYDDVIHQINSKSARNQDALSHTVEREEEAEIQIDPETGEPQM